MATLKSNKLYDCTRDAKESLNTSVCQDDTMSHNSR